MKKTFGLIIFAFILGCSGTTAPGHTDLSTGTDGLDAQETLEDVQHALDNMDSGTDLSKTDTNKGCVDGEPCDDGDPCTFGETCKDGKCQGGKAYSCDDSRPCTTDQCDGKGGCIYKIQEGFCLVNGKCYKDGEGPEYNDCLVCDSKKDNKAFQNKKNGQKCQDFEAPNLCTDVTSAVCKDGRCVPDKTIPKGCDDSNPCTEDSCDPQKGCINTPVKDGTKCFLDDPCKEGQCMQGHCIVPENASCDDHNPCTKDECTAKGCKHTPLDGVACDDNNACTTQDHCVNGECKGEEVNCNDGNICTEDGCDPVVGCWHDIQDNPCCKGGVSICDDHDPCTDDTCDPDTHKCIYKPNHAACDDKDPCTINDTCDNKKCVGTPKDCNDGNPCTQDSCDQSTGKCVNTVVADGTPCDDGLACSTGDHCEAGKCIADTTNCLCTPDFSNVVTKVTSMHIQTTGYPGDGLDIDEDPNTCAPKGKCSDGIDNALGSLGAMGNDSIAKEMKKGSVMVLFDHKGFNTQGKPYTLGIYAGKLDPKNSGCDFEKDVCDYLVDPNSYDHDTCEPLVKFDNATIHGNKLTAGGKKYTFPFHIPLNDQATLDFALYYARIEATVTIQNGRITHIQGIIGGAVPKQKMLDAVDQLPDDVQLPGGLTKENLKQLINAMIHPDIDGDGDGVPESASIGIQFEGIAGNITGVIKK